MTDEDRNRGLDDLRDAFPRWSESEIQRYREQYQQHLRKLGDKGFPFHEWAKSMRRYRQSLRDRGLPVDDPPHEDSHVIIEYDPPSPRCPKCSCTSYIYMDAPRHSAGEQAFQEWMRDVGGKLQCPQCLEVFDLEPQLPKVVKRVRLETLDEVLARHAEEVDKGIRKETET